MIRDDFPILKSNVAYFDNAATTQMPSLVWKAMSAHQFTHHANVHRGIYSWSEKSTQDVESVRGRVAAFIGASADEIIFTSGTTDSINKLSRMMIRKNTKLRAISTCMEHHSNLLPWQNADCRICDVTDDGALDLNCLENMLRDGADLLSITYISNVTGIINPVRRIIKIAHDYGCLVFLDCAQAMRHEKINVRELDCDFLAFSGHKICGPTGTGILYGKKALLEGLSPSDLGGGMVDDPINKIWREIPHRFEAGTPNITGIVGLGSAIDYIDSIGIEKIAKCEDMLLGRIYDLLEAHKNIQLVGLSNEKSYAGAISFNVAGLHCFDVAKMLDSLGVAARSGHHCARPFLTRLSLDGCVRLSPAFYNNDDDLCILEKALNRISKVI